MPVLRRKDYWVKESIKDESFDSQYELGKELGRGIISNVCKCQRRGLNQSWAVKILYKNRDKKVATAEVGVLLGLDHKNLIRLKEVFESKSKIYLVQELVTGGELFDRLPNLGKYSEKEVVAAMFDIVSGIKYLHSWDIVHRNIKPENLLYENLADNSKLKIADYGLSSILSSDVAMSSVCGSPQFIAPEILKGERDGKAGDLWSIGVICFILLCGSEPFPSMVDSPAQMFKCIIKGQYEFNPRLWDDIGDNAKDFVRKLLVVDSRRRLTAEAAARNCWLNGFANKQTDLADTRARLQHYNTRRRAQAGLRPPSLSPAGPTSHARYFRVVDTFLPPMKTTEGSAAENEAAVENQYGMEHVENDLDRFPG